MYIIDDIDTEIIAMHYGIVQGGQPNLKTKFQEFSRSIPGVFY